MNSSVLVILVTFNPMQWVERCLNSIRNSSIPIDAIIIDNGSTDGSQYYIQKYFPEFKFIQNANNDGFGKANNIGLNYAVEKGYDYVYLLNQDAWFYSNTLETLIEDHKRNPEYGILSPLQLEANERHFDSNFAKYTIRDRISENTLDNKTAIIYDAIVSTDFVMAAHWLISKECLMVVGGFSPSFKHYGEDDNYCQRALFHNFKIGISTRASAIHDRENRTLSKEKRIYLENVHRIVDISNPNLNNTQSLYYYFKDCLYSARKNKSILPLKYYCDLLKSWKQLQKNKTISKGERAFIK